MDVSIVVNHYKSPQMLKLNLSYLKNWQKEFEAQPASAKDHGETRAEIIVTDSETIPETTELMRNDFPEIKFLAEPKNIGFGRSVNRALAQAHGEYIFIVNADLMIPSPESLDKMIEHISQNKDIGMIGPALKNFDETHQPSAFRYYTPLLIALRRSPLGKMRWGREKIDRFMLRDVENLLQKPQEVDWVMGSAMLTRKEYLDRLGFFDDRYFMYMEDVDLCRRFWENGLKVIYYPRATMYHFHIAASRSRNIFKSLLNKYTRIHIASAWKYFRKHGLKTPHHGI